MRAEEFEVRCPACGSRAITFSDWLGTPQVFWGSLQCRACTAPLAGHSRQIAVWAVCAVLCLLGGSLAWLYFWSREVPPRPEPFLFPAALGIAASGFLLWRDGRYSLRADTGGDAEANKRAVARTAAKPLTIAARWAMGVVGLIAIGLGIHGGITGVAASRLQIVRVEPGSAPSWLWGSLVISVGLFLLIGAFLIDYKKPAVPEQ